MDNHHHRRGDSRIAPTREGQTSHRDEHPLNRRYNPDIHHRKSIRLKGYDYSQAGAYYVTIATHERRVLFGDVVDGEMRLNESGQLVVDVWEWLAARHSYVELDSYVVMPNHLHGIIVIDDPRRGDSRIAPTRHKPLGRLVGMFKTVTTKQVNLAQGTPGQRLWQRNYYERVIRNDEEWNRVREYIAANPTQWEIDVENPNATS